MEMMLFAAALAIAQPQVPAASVAAQATATIRVLRAVRLKLDAPENPDAPRPRESLIKTADGSSHPAKLIEFQ